MSQPAAETRPVVLIVEDEPLLRMMAADLAEEAGFTAVEAYNADEAIAILEVRRDIAIVFTDIDMPGSMDGARLAAAVRDRWPPIHIIATSGHVMARNLRLPAGTVFFSKPYRAQDIIGHLRTMAPR